VIDDPTLVTQQGGHPAAAIAVVLTGQLDDPFGQTLLIIGWLFIVSLDRSWQHHHPTGSAFRHIQNQDGLVNSLELPVG